MEKWKNKFAQKNSTNKPRQFKIIKIELWLADLKQNLVFVKVLQQEPCSTPTLIYSTLFRCFNISTTGHICYIGIYLK